MWLIPMHGYTGLAFSIAPGTGSGAARHANHGNTCSIRQWPIAIAVLALELLHLVVGVIVRSDTFAVLGIHIDWSFSFTPWVAVLLLFVLARVFEQGVRARGSRRHGVTMAIIVKLDDMLHKRRMTLTELSEQAGIALSILKTGKARAMRFSTWEAICATLQCQPGALLAYDASVPIDPE